MSNIQAAQPAAHSVPNTNGGQPQYIAPIDHAQQIPASAYSHVYSNTAERGYTMHLPQDSQIIQNRIQAGSGNHNVVTVIPGQQTMQQSRFVTPQRMMMPQGPHGHPQSQMPPFNAAPAGYFYPQNMNMVPPPTFWQYPAPTSEQAQMNPMNMNPNFNIPVMMPPPMYQHQQPPMTAPTQQTSQQKPREKKILMIVDPNSKQVVNENEINASKVPSSHETTENKPPSVQTSVPSTSESANISQQFTRAVSNRLLSEKVQESDASATETRSSSVTLSVDFNDNKSETNLTQESKGIPDYSTIPSEQLNGQFEKSGTQSLIEEELKEEQPEDGQEISEIDTARSIKEGETEGELPNDSESKENEDLILEDLEKKMQQYYEQAKDNIDNMVYDRNFLQIIREVVSNLNKSGNFVQPLKTEEELKEMGIDQAGMPAISQSLSRDRPRKEMNRNDAFKPGFMSGIGSNQQNRGSLHPPHYSGRRSDKKDHRKAQVIARPSITRQSVVETLRKAENAWKPSLGKADEKEKKRKEIRGILNKITPSTFEDLKNEFIGQKLYEDESTLPMIVDLIFDKAVEEPKFVSLYSTLCKVQTEEEQKVQNSTRPFRLAIIKKCQMTFERTTNNSTEEAIENTQKEIDEETKKEEKDEKKLKELQERLEELQGKEKRRMLGTIRFIGELYRHMLITDNIIQWCAIHLIKQYQTSNDDVYIEYVVQLIETVGPIHEKRKASTPVVQPQHSSQQTPLSMSQLLGHLDQLKDVVSTRIRFAIMDLIELKDNNWVPRHGNTGPKTKEQIRNEVVQEELKNEEERKDYEKKQQQYRERDYDQRRAKPYGGRGSLDTKFVDQKRAQAAQASQATSTNLRKDVSIKSALSDAHGPLKKQSWAAGAAGGGGSIGLKQQQSQQKVIPRYAGRGSENTHRESSSLQSTSRDQHSRSSTPKQNERKGGPLMTKASSEDPALPESLEELSDITEQEGSSSQEKVVVEPEVNPEKIKNSVKSYLEEYLENHAELREASDNIKRHCTNAELTRIVFTSMFDYSVNKFKPTEDDKRRKVGEVFRRALQAKELKSDAIQGVVDFVENAVDSELDMDVPQVWEYIAFIIYTAILTDESKEEKEEGAVRPALQDFTPVFVLLANKEEVRKPFGLLTLVLKGMIDNFKQNQAEDIPTIMSMTFTELREADQFYKSDALAEALRSEKISIGEFENLYSLLNS